MSSEVKVYKKRPHRKVKSGCQTCKRRKIKCDEVKPQCSNCQRYAAECVYPTLADLEQGGSSTTPPVPSPESYTEDYFGGPDLPMMELGLMHQWVISTCYGFGDKFAEDVKPWREEIPVLGQRFPFLMRGLLALSALHLGRQCTDLQLKLKYLRTAAYHQDHAIPEYRSTLLDVTKDNVAAVLAFSAMLTTYSLAAPKDSEATLIDGPPEWIFLHRGIWDMPSHWQSWIDDSVMCRQMDRHRLQPVDPSANPEDHHLCALQTLISTLPPDQADDRPAYEGALYWLRQAYAHTFTPNSMLGAMFALLFWIEKVPQSYMDLLGARMPRAMVFLGNAVVLLKRVSHAWFLDGCAEKVLMDIKSMIGSELFPWIEWPWRACGMV